MSVERVRAPGILHELHRYDAIIDARSPSEYAADHLPGAVNWPSLDDEQRARVGTRYKQDPFQARKLGAALVARNIARHVEQHLAETPQSWQPLVYCWRGGQRSSALATVLGQIGFHVQVLAGGYKAFRKAMLAELPARARNLHYRVVCGPTGSGKTRLLHALAATGAQVLDLEGLARHRASVLGAIPGQPQPTQKHFEMQLWHTLGAFDPQRPVFVEAESRKVGDLTVPGALMDCMRTSPCLLLHLPDEERVALLLEDYPAFMREPQRLCERLQALVRHRGHATVQRWQDLVRAGHFQTLVQELLQQHYDPGYARSTRRNYSQFGSAAEIRLENGGAAELARATRAILALPPPQ